MEGRYNYLVVIDIVSINILAELLLLLTEIRGEHPRVHLWEKVNNLLHYSLGKVLVVCN